MLSVSSFKSRPTPKASLRRVRGLPVLIPYVALFGYRRPAIPECCPGYKKTALGGLSVT